MFLLWLRQLPWCGDWTPASLPPPAEGRSSPTSTPVFSTSSFILPSFARFYIVISTGQVLLSAPSWCSACASVSEGVFLMYPWREMYSTSTYSSATLFSKAYFLKLYFSQYPLMETSLPACSVEKFNMETDYKGVGRNENAKVVETGHRLATSESFFHHKSGATKAGIVFSEPRGWDHSGSLGWCIYSSLSIFLMYQIICHWWPILMEESNDKVNVNTLRYSVINIFSNNFNSLISWELETWKGASLHSWKSFFQHST